MNGQDDWDSSTEGSFLAGVNLPPQGVPCTLVAIRKDQMDRREGTGKETVYIGAFNDLNMEWVINKTNRRFLKEECGISNANVNRFAPIPLTLFPNQTNLGTGIRAVPRVVTPQQAATPNPQAAPPNQQAAAPTQQAAPPAQGDPAYPGQDDDVPF